MPLERSDRLGALVRHLPFAVDDFDAARDVYARWREAAAEEDRRTAQLWAYCYVVWYFYGKFARDRTAGPSDLDRVIERACRRIFRSMAGVRDPERFPQFVSVVCRNVLSSYRIRRHPTVELHDVAAPTPTPEVEALDRPIVRQAVVRAIDALPPAVGEVARMRLIEGRSYPEIADATGHPLATTRTYYSKALVKLREDPGLRAVYLGEPPAEAALAAGPVSAAEDVQEDIPRE